MPFPGTILGNEETHDSEVSLLKRSSEDLNCGRVFGRIAFIAVADITDAIAVIAGIAVVNFSIAGIAGFGSSDFGRCHYRYITAAISVTDRYLNPCFFLEPPESDYGSTIGFTSTEGPAYGSFDIYCLCISFRVNIFDPT
ncbi:hypothetical protein GOBAR_AA39968 [Gossypium barbadense]|uniref:Uncharacterized protein n=1 Tax=Gossypium barbadense TaxID=3634 RepID=A0A2P5VPI2_GOSBA|nr:hypothetical protein GOBAR_AA39968 [Gossypium barbadense]